MFDALEVHEKTWLVSTAHNFLGWCNLFDRIEISLKSTEISLSVCVLVTYRFFQKYLTKFEETLHASYALHKDDMYQAKRCT